MISHSLPKLQKFPRKKDKINKIKRKFSRIFWRANRKKMNTYTKIYTGYDDPRGDPEFSIPKSL
jgi:hypothetical protein